MRRAGGGVGTDDDAPEWTRTTTPLTQDKALNQIRGAHISPRVSRSSILSWFLDASDGSGGVDVLKYVLTGGAISWLEPQIVGRMLYGLGMTETEVIAEIGRRLAAAVPVGSQVVLFGSRARVQGLADEGSDYDVLVIEPAVENHVEESVRLRGELDDLRSPIDVIVFAEDVARERAAVRGTVVDRALREGRVLAHASSRWRWRACCLRRPLVICPR